MHTRIYTCMYTVLYLYSMLHVHVHTVHVHCTSSFVSIILLVGGSEGAECMGGAKRGLDGLRGERIVSEREAKREAASCIMCSSETVNGKKTFICICSFTSTIFNKKCSSTSLNTFERSSRVPSSTSKSIFKHMCICAHPMSATNVCICNALQIRAGTDTRLSR